jgi:exonuclease III
MIVQQTSKNTHSFKFYNQTPTSPNILTTKQSILTLATLNVSTLTDSKVIDLQDLMLEQKIQILALSETNRPDSQTKHLFNNNKQKLIAHFHNTDQAFKGKGVGIILSEIYDRHIYNKGVYNGRIIYLDLHFKPKKKIRIINYYGEANKNSADHRDEYEKTKEKLLQIIQEAKHKNMELILMGDFNSKYESYSKDKMQGKKQNTNTNIFYALEEKYNLCDPQQIMYDITPNKPQYTFIPRNKETNPSRIDYIYVTEKILEDTINANIIDVNDTIKTDHRLLKYTFWTSEILGIIEFTGTNRKNQKSKTIYKYNEMEEANWKEFKEI